MAEILLREDGGKLLTEKGDPILLRSTVGAKYLQPPMRKIPKLQFRHGTTAEWAAANPVLALAEPGVDTTNGDFKLGDGVKTWSAIPLNYAPLSLTAQPRGVVAIGTPFDPAVAASESFLSGPLTYTFDPTRRYRVSYTFRAFSGAGGGKVGGTIQCWLWDMFSGVQISVDQIFSADAAFYHGGTLSWTINPSGPMELRVRTTTYLTAGAYAHCRDYYLEDIGAI